MSDTVASNINVNHTYSYKNIAMLVDDLASKPKKDISYCVKPVS